MDAVQLKLTQLAEKKLKREIAEEVGVTAGFISAVLRGRKKASPKLLAYLGLEKIESYRVKPVGVQE